MKGEEHPNEDPLDNFHTITWLPHLDLLFLFGHAHFFFKAEFKKKSTISHFLHVRMDEGG